VGYLQWVSQCPLPLCRLVALLHWNLFTYGNIWDWLADPFATPPEQPPYQLDHAFWTAAETTGGRNRTSDK
jgi:hypothetical protein